MSRRSGRSRWTLVLLLLTSITVLTLDFRGSSAIQEVRDRAAAAFSPLRGAADSVFGPVADAWNGAFDYDDVKSENEQLRAEIDRLEADAAQGAAAAEALAERESIEGLAVLSEVEAVTARVIAGPSTNFDDSIELDKGSDAGIEVGMPVVTGGLVGRVVQTTGSRSVVQIVTDPDFVVGVRLTSSQDVAVTRGGGDDNPLLIESGVDPKVVVLPGEVVVTSGLERAAFPAGIPVGTVLTVDSTADRLGQRVTVAPLADLGKLSIVKVLLWKPPS